MSNFNSNFATFLRTLVAALGPGLLVISTGETQEFSSLSGHSVLFLVQSWLATGASWLCYFGALQLDKVSRVAPIGQLSVVFVALIAAVLLGEKLSFTGWSGVAPIAVGAVLVAAA